MHHYIVAASQCVIIIATAITGSQASQDQFNYRGTIGNDYGPEDWGQVQCNEVGDCSGWPDGWELGVGWELEENNCKWCPESGDHDCGVHRQSPINLERSEATTGHSTECIDYHWMAYEDGSCKWHDMVKNGYTENESQFQIQRHSLQILQPIDENGELQCDSDGLGRQFPRLDYSKGFPDWWHLSHTEITVPSEHTQEGKRYDAEVHLAHFYSVDHERRVGKVAIFLEADPNKQERWDFLDKLICEWREVEEKQRDECGLESVPPYPGCRNPDREVGETNLPQVDPYPFIDCASVVNSQRICKPTSCCESERNPGEYCQNDVYDFYGDEVVGSICWWCCPGKLLAPAESDSPSSMPSSKPSSFPTTTSPSQAPSNLSSNHPSRIPSSTPTEIPTPTSFSQSPSTDPSENPSFQPTYNITMAPFSDRSEPFPTFSSTPSSQQSLRPSKTAQQLVCSDYDNHPDINLDRICMDGGCCDPVRSSTDRCHMAYKFFGDSMADVCSDCCNPSKEAAPAPPPHPIYPPIDCTAVSNPFRICKPTSCCNEVQSTSNYCKTTYELYGESMGSVCWYCCSEPKEVDPDVLPSNRTLTFFPTGVPSSGDSLAPSSLPSVERTFPSSTPTSNAETNAPFGFPPNYLKTVFPSDPSAVPTSMLSAPPSSKASSTTTSAITATSEMPSMTPSSSQTESPTVSPIVCSDFPDINFGRICKAGGCCDEQRSSTDHCHSTYKFFGEKMESVCSDCCNPAKQLAPAPPPHPTYPPIDCTLVDNPYRICKPNSCCDETRSTSDYCLDTYSDYGEEMMGSVCWYCCSEPKEFAALPTRNLRGGSKETVAAKAVKKKEMNENDKEVDVGDAPVTFDVRLPQGMFASELKMDPPNFEATPNVEEEFLDSIKEYQRQQTASENQQRDANARKLNNLGPGDNYINVPYSPYQWMREVKTEYYYRYEGTQMVPPCYETVHYRVMKDPIRIHPDQLAELERLLAWRISPKGSETNECQRDTAGKDREGANGNAVDLNRPLQSYHNTHRKVFCECIDWESKFAEDREWCTLDDYTRRFVHPYNFDSPEF